MRNIVKSERKFKITGLPGGARAHVISLRAQSPSSSSCGIWLTTPQDFPTKHSTNDGAHLCLSVLCVLYLLLFFLIFKWLTYLLGIIWLWLHKSVVLFSHAMRERERERLCSSVGCLLACLVGMTDRGKEVVVKRRNIHIHKSLQKRIDSMQSFGRAS